MTAVGGWRAPGASDHARLRIQLIRAEAALLVQDIVSLAGIIAASGSDIDDDGLRNCHVPVLDTRHEGIRLGRGPDRRAASC